MRSSLPSQGRLILIRRQSTVFEQKNESDLVIEIEYKHVNVGVLLKETGK